MVKERNESVDNRVESERNLLVSRPLTPSVTTSFRTTSDHLCSSLCSSPLLTLQFICVVPLLIASLTLEVDLLSVSPVTHTAFTSHLCIPQTVAPDVFLLAILQLPRNPFVYGGRESGPENDAPLLQGSHRSNLSASVASKVSLGRETGQTIDVANKTPVRDTHTPLR